MNFPGRQDQEEFSRVSSLNYPLSKEVKEIYLERTFLEGKPGELLKLVSRLDSLDSDGYKGKIEDKYPMLLEGRGVMKASYCNALTEDAKPFQAPVPVACLRQPYVCVHDSA